MEHRNDVDVFGEQYGVMAILGLERAWRPNQFEPYWCVANKHPDEGSFSTCMYAGQHKMRFVIR